MPLSCVWLRIGAHLLQVLMPGRYEVLLVPATRLLPDSTGSIRSGGCRKSAWGSSADGGGAVTTDRPVRHQAAQSHLESGLPLWSSAFVCDVNKSEPVFLAACTDFGDLGTSSMGECSSHPVLQKKPWLRLLWSAAARLPSSLRGL